MKDLKQIAILCFLSDVGISVWSYNQLTNYDEYVKSAKAVIPSPDLQLQVYQILLQSFTFSLLIFLIFHLIIYILLWREKLYAIKYVRFYTIMAALSALIMIISLKSPVVLIPLAIYVLSYKSINTWLKDTAKQKQSMPQSTK